MSISTKTGDKGTTGLWSGQRVKKNSVRVEAYGTIDELDTHLSEALLFVKDEYSREIILEVQQLLYRTMGELATKDKEFKALIKAEEVERITEYVHKLESEVQLTGFVKTGRTIQSAKLDICRAIVRRGERRILELNDIEEVSEQLKKLVNRLSDLFFILARFEEKRLNKLEYKTL